MGRKNQAFRWFCELPYNGPTNNDRGATRHHMTQPFQRCATAVDQLYNALVALEDRTELLQIEPLAGREWFELLRQKLVPQLRDDAFLVVAVVGGTNIGKSVIFNHLAGCRASATSPLATGTKHPVCLVPPGFEKTHDLAAIFESFKLYSWNDSDQALKTTDEHMLFWRESESTPPELLVLDTPDVDSDAPMNWIRADAIRRSADVLLAVLTQQKYNDAAVKDFFRKAAEEDKAVIIVFNQCLLPEDEEYWPVWLNTFCSETGIKPEAVYIAPNDRKAAEENRLSFFERRWPADSDRQVDDKNPRSLTDDLAKLRFHEIKFRTLKGSLKHLLREDRGVPLWLRELNQKSEEFSSASDRLSSESVSKIRDWPPIGNDLIVAEVRRWWKSRQEGWARRVNGFYDTVGGVVVAPFKFARDKISGEPEDPVEAYREREWSAILRTVDEVYEKLEFMAESGAELLKPRLQKVLAGKSRADLLEKLRTEHEAVDFQKELEDTVDIEMRAFEAGSPDMYAFYRQIHNLSAAVRPAASVVFFALGAGPAGEAVAPLVADAAGQAIATVVADFAGGTVAAVAGETAVSEAAGKGSGFLQAKFQKLQTSFTSARVNWLVERLKNDLLGSLPEEFDLIASIPRSEEYAVVQSAIRELADAVGETAPTEATTPHSAEQNAIGEAGV